MQVTNHSNNKRKMKEELLEAIYGTVERLEQKVDELSASPKNAGAETIPASVSVDTNKLEEAFLSVSAKEEETIEKLARLRDAICVYIELTKKETSKDEQRSKLLLDTIKQLKQEQDTASQMIQDELHAISNTPHYRKLSPFASSLPQSLFFFSLLVWVYPLFFPFWVTSPNGESTKIGRRQI